MGFERPEPGGELFASMASVPSAEGEPTEEFVETVAGGGSLYAALMRFAAPAAVLVDGRMRVLETHGETERFLGAAGAGVSLIDLLPKSTHGRLQSQFLKASRTGEKETRILGDARVTIFKVGSSDPRYLITFEETDGEPAGAYDAVLGLDACVAVLDGVGTIIGCNDAWR
ncbi:MAG: hypothetical protein SFV51_12550, partial [Bryobacteraceae bacterium]|nr:hypothetical protein [Bryobacteraceae bacterium]